MKNPALSIITIHWNGKEDLNNFYKSLFKQSFTNFEVIF